MKRWTLFFVAFAWIALLHFVLSGHSSAASLASFDEVSPIARPLVPFGV